MRRGRKVGIALGGVLLAGIGGLYLTPFGDALRDVAGTGVIGTLMNRRGTRRIEGDTVERLKAIRTALDLYHDSEERYPLALGWTDAAVQRLGADDLAKGEAEKRVVRPGAGAYGYALNRAAAGKYRDDIGPKTTILVYETGAETKDAAGDPVKDGLPGGKGVTIAGEILPLDQP